MSKTRHITTPKGFVAAGVACGVKAGGKKDLAIIAAQRDAAGAIVTTQNQVVGAAITWCRKVLPQGHGRVRGIVINAGNANTSTGRGGERDAATMAAATATQLGTSPEKVLVASTGVIGETLPITKIRNGIAAAGGKLGNRNDRAALQAMMTTDTVEKSAVAKIRIGGRAVTVAGVVKGSGMIAPNMATMIAVLTTDAPVTSAALHKTLTPAVAKSFNTITVDGDTSTSDIAVLLASGAAGGMAITVRSGQFKTFARAVELVCGRLARAVVADGEGATKVIDITVRGARNAAEAQAAAKSVANSLLVKCAIGGGDPNFGRIAAALGKSAAKVVTDKLRITVGGMCVFSRASARKFDLNKAARLLRRREVKIICDLGLGRGTYTALTCDLTKRYVTINAQYHT